MNPGAAPFRQPWLHLDPSFSALAHFHDESGDFMTTTAPSLETTITPSLPLVGLSRCLTGASVRFDGGAKRNGFVMDKLGMHANFTTVCPEADAGLGVPRPALRLLSSDGSLRMVESQSGRDQTGPVERAIEDSMVKLESEPLCGFVVTRRSPSCGLERVPVYLDNGRRASSGEGLLVTALKERMPLVPIEENGRLKDDGLRDRFLTRVFTLHRWRQTCGASPTLANLQSFHAENKSLLTAHDEASTRALGRSIASCKASQAGDLAHAYIAQVMTILNRPVGRGAHINVLQHVLGHFRGTLQQPTRHALQFMLREYAHGHVRLAAVRGLFHHHAQQVGSQWLREQTYFAPYPVALRAVA
jgi:uncharacterized protein YbbK (DUF523 family)/uncharacterized protein YbgA (DUF1722 family)